MVTLRKKIARFYDNQIRKKLRTQSIYSLSRIIVYTFLISMSFVLIYPMLYMIVMAFRPLSEMSDPTTVWISSSLTLSNLITMWKQLDFGRLLFNSVYLSFGSAVLSTCICAMTGYGFARFKFREKGVWMFVLFITIIVPPSVLSVAGYIQMKDFSIAGIIYLLEFITGNQYQINLLDTVSVYYLPAIFGAGISSGIFILIFSQFFKGFPKELEDSAYIDGAGPIKTFAKIVIPNMKPPVVVVFLLSTVWYWNDTYISGTYTLNLSTISRRLLYVYTDMVQILGVAGGRGLFSEDVPLIQASMLMAVIPMILIFIFCQKIFVESVTTSGIVG